MTANQACCACAAVQLTVHGRADSPKEWMDRPYKNTCATYAAEQWCTSTGGYGPEWDMELWGAFDDYQRQGVSADEACAACGGGKACIDTTIGWEDSQGYTCGDYIDNGWCTSGGDYGSNWGASRFSGTFDDYATDGQSAVEACCACGGGAEGACANGSATFDAGWGGCATYQPGGPNHAFCAVDYDASQGVLAMHTCPHCGACQQECVSSEGAAEDKGGYTCAGGYSAAPSTFCGYYDDADFTAGEMCCECGGGQKEEWAQWAGHGAANPVLLGLAEPSWASVRGAVSFGAGGATRAQAGAAVAAVLAEYVGARKANVHADASPIARRRLSSNGGVSAWSVAYEIQLPSGGSEGALQLLRELADQAEAAQEDDSEEINGFAGALAARLAESAGVDAGSFSLQGLSQPESAAAQPGSTTSAGLEISSASGASPLASALAAAVLALFGFRF
mmetsp:Transcript_34267/g.91826  ORF Transcript_34267/g.91826 Transcript_34267/m.91826 type:complete len:450 (+) Transcript_34267:339-1688(+)